MSEDSVFKETSKKLESKDLGIEIPVDLVTLPSRGSVYGPEHPFHNVEETEIRCMSAKEEDLLTSRALIKKGTVVTELLKACLLNKAVDVDSLLVGDRNALLIAIRVSGYGPEYSVRIECPNCGEQFDNSFSLANLKIKRLSIEPTIPNSNVFSFKLPSSGWDVQFKLFTGADDLLLSQDAEKRKKMGLQIDNLVTRRLVYSLTSINGETDKQKISRMVSSLRAGDSLALRRYIDQIEPGVDMNQEAQCKSCGDSSTVDVPVGPTFFWPDFGQ